MTNIYKANKLSTEQRIEYALCNLEKANKKVRSFHKDYQTYLATQRNILIDDIINSLKKVGRKRHKGIFYRVVSAKYMNDPLCTSGSLLYSGRFNFGNISYDYTPFACLYVSNNLDGAKHEKFPNKENEFLSTSEMSLIPNDSFLTSRCKINLTKCMDIRTTDSLIDFTKVIAQINPTNSFQRKWRKMNRKVSGKNKVEKLETIKKPEVLSQYLLEVYYEQWITWLDIPSNSQWFGHYVKETGIEAIIYPSVRYKECYNLAIYPENFGSKSYVCLIDEHTSVPIERIEINKKNYKFFEQSFENFSVQ